MSEFFSKLKEYEIWLLRVAIAFPMLWAGISGLRNPSAWIGFVPDFIDTFLTKQAFLVIDSWLLIVWAVLLLLGPYRWFFAAMAMLHLAGILMFAGIDDITFRDVGLLLVAIVLFVREYESRHLSSVG